MKIKKLGALLVSAALCAGMAAPAFAFEGEAAPVEQPVLPEVVEEDVVTVTDETSGALTPEGNLTLVDDYHTDYSDGSGQQFITLVSKSGATFYLVIDRNAKGQQTVHFMNLVDEADLLALMRPPGRRPRGGRRKMVRLRGGVSRCVRRRHPPPRQARRGARARAGAVRSVHVGGLLHVPRLRSARRTVLAGHGHAGAAVHRGELLSHAGRVRRERGHVLPRLLAAVRRLSDHRHAHLASGVVLSHDRAGLHRRRGRARDAAPRRNVKAHEIRTHGIGGF